ncbi:hypothetical protein U27_05172 [Candidatus Vecturithrix granuli]|uniref:EamA domain-containing protein n=1 Tax=Vecturithrix granuli TaxID=1499967 RepID=A0A081C0U4_VECG1|nr:hypothetical protein U27_05172 [Candidatus Vecturithrix granuli]
MPAYLRSIKKMFIHIGSTLPVFTEKKACMQTSKLIKLGQRLFDLPYILLPLAPLFWSGNFILGRAVRTALPPVGLAFWRWLVASLVMSITAWPHVKHDWPAIQQNWKIIGLLSILGVATFNVLAYTGLRFTTAMNGVLMQSAMPVMIIVMSYFFFRETITLLQAAGILLSLSGVVTIITQGNLRALTSLSLNPGDLVILVAITCYAVYSVLLRRRPPVNPLSLLLTMFVIGTGLLFPFYVWEHLFLQVMPFNRVTLLAVGYVAIFPSILAYLCFNRGVELLGANRAGLFLHLMPVFGSLMAMLFLGEQFRSFHAAGICLILSGIVLATKKQKIKSAK